nr:DUF202 domain-containing protein [Alkalicoccus halolimnae]
MTIIRRGPALKERQEAFYIQQHLANERTFLAWVRTALAMKGIGLLVFGLELALGSGEGAGRTASLGVSLVSYAAGMTVLASAVVLYFRSRRQINNEEFQSSGITVILTGILVGVILTALLIYTIFVYY